MSPHSSPLEQLIDALQAAVLSAQAVALATPDLSPESRRLVAAVTRAGLCAHALRDGAGR
jgi:hypothetical protein